jgi:hypothetical protein
LLQALRGAEGALARDRWLTDTSLRDWLKREVQRYITHERSTGGPQTPQAIVSASNTFRIRHVPKPRADLQTELAALSLKNRDEYLEGVETGRIRDLDGFKRGNRVPDSVNDHADAWVCRLLADQIADELQRIYNRAKEALELRRRDMGIEAENAQGNVDTPYFRYAVDTMQNPDAAAEYAIVRRLNLLTGWLAHRTAIASIFSNEFSQVVIEFDRSGFSYDDIVDKLEEVSPNPKINQAARRCRIRS